MNDCKESVSKRKLEYKVSGRLDVYFSMVYFHPRMCERKVALVDDSTRGGLGIEEK